jgi:hypothetical protein
VGYYERAHTRAVRLFSADAPSHADEMPAVAHTFTADEFPGYETGTLRMIDDPLTAVQRWQRSSLCYMHAGVVAQYYALWHHKLSKDVPDTTPHAMIDMQEDIKERFDAEALRRHVFDDKGWDSRVYLESLLLPHCILTGSVPMEWYAEYLRLYGPALVSAFRVHEDFSDHAVHHHYDANSGKFVGLHAMVLVGAREDEIHGWCFLLQNWWLNKQFVEVNAAYLERSAANVFFIKTPQNHMNTNLPTVEGRWFECDMLDKPECLNGEDM